MGGFCWEECIASGRQKYLLEQKHEQLIEDVGRGDTHSSCYFFLCISKMAGCPESLYRTDKVSGLRAAIAIICAQLIDLQAGLPDLERCQD